MIPLIPIVIIAILINACAPVKLPQIPIGPSANSVTRLISPSNEAGGTGFEVLVKGRSYTLTNDHVCNLGKKEGYLLAVPSNGQVQRIKILLQSEVTDLCILEPVDTLRPLSLADSSWMKEYIHIVGHPLLGPLKRTDGKIRKEETIKVLEFPIVDEASEKACVGQKHSIQEILFGKACIATIHAEGTSAWIKPGSSGSPVLDSQERVVGVAFASEGMGGGTAWIIPLEDIRTFLEKFLARQPA